MGIFVRPCHTRPQGVFEHHLTMGELLDISLEISLPLTPEQLDDAIQPLFQAGTEKRELVLDGSFGELFDGDPEAFRRLPEGLGNLLVAEAQSQGLGRFHVERIGQVPGKGNG